MVMPVCAPTAEPDTVTVLAAANGFATSFTPDGFDRLSTTTYPDSSTQVELR
jgi:hypothetical protein